MLVFHSTSRVHLAPFYHALIWVSVFGVALSTSSAFISVGVTNLHGEALCCCRCTSVLHEGGVTGPRIDEDCVVSTYSTSQSTSILGSDLSVASLATPTRKRADDFALQRLARNPPLLGERPKCPDLARVNSLVSRDTAPQSRGRIVPDA